MTIKCSNYRTISIASKTLLGIIKERIKNKIQQCVSGDQFSVRSGIGTREAILPQIILEHILDKNQNAIVAFIDLEKAFDIVNWELQFDYMKKVGIHFEDKREKQKSGKE